MYSGHDSAKVMLMTEGNGGQATATYWSWYQPWAATRGAFPHNDGQNVLYGDGHAKWLTKSAIIGGFNTFGLEQ